MMDDDDTQSYERPWVGLTDEEIKQAYKERCKKFDHWYDERTFWMAANWVEAKLKEKNT